MFTNHGNISLPIAVWLADDDYDLQTPPPKTISATSFLKPLKSLLLSQRIAASSQIQDLQDVIAGRMGSAIHTAVEVSWLNDRYKRAMTKLDYPQHVIDAVRVNPTNPDPNDYNIYVEIRTEKMLAGWTVSGKFDFVEQARVKDVKSTAVYNWIHGGNDAKYGLQGSIYKWLNPTIILDEYMDVEFVFKDWKALMALADKTYPQKSVMTRTIPLKSTFEIESFMRDKIALLETHANDFETDMPRCTPDEVWQRPSTWAYYKNPLSLKRATKVFDNEWDANTRRENEGNVGMVQHRPGEVKFCRYCPAHAICQQAESYIQQGLLEL